MIQAGLSGVEFWIANTDLQALDQAACPNQIQIGRGITRGLGAGGDPEIGRLSAEEDRDAIAEVLRGADMLFVTAGMGGGTGTGAAPVVAEVARELGILTVAVVTRPFTFEGKKKMARAVAGLAELGGNVDTLIAIPNQKLLNIVEPGTPFRAAMLVADEVLLQATRGISDLITGHGEINLDFADVKSVMRNRGNAILGCGVGEGPERAVEAAQSAVSSPLLEEVSILGAEALLINVQGGSGMTLHEAAEAARFISERVGEEADVFWGAVVDPSLGEEMRVTLIATGFPRADARPAEEARLAAERTSPLAPERTPVFPSERPAALAAERTSGLPPPPFPVPAASPVSAPLARSPLPPAETREPAPSVTAPVFDLLSVREARTARAEEEVPLAADLLSTARAAGLDRTPEPLEEVTPAPATRTDPSELFLAAREVDSVRRPSEEVERPSRPKEANDLLRRLDRMLRSRTTEDEPEGAPLAEDRPVPSDGGGAWRPKRISEGPRAESPRVAPAAAARTRYRRGGWFDEESGLEARLGRRGPLDKPAFMRKKMD
jgi:cell division protein FtsZ